MATITFKMKVRVMKIKPYQSQNTSMKLNHTRKTNNLKKSDIWKIQLKGINFISSKDTDEEQVMHSRGDDIEINWAGNINER